MILEEKNIKKSLPLIFFIYLYGNILQKNLI
jgi:hypothetical protein